MPAPSPSPGCLRLRSTSQRPHCSLQRGFHTRAEWGAGQKGKDAEDHLAAAHSWLFVSGSCCITQQLRKCHVHLTFLKLMEVGGSESLCPSLIPHQPHGHPGALEGAAWSTGGTLHRGTSHALGHCGAQSNMGNENH